MTLLIGGAFALSCHIMARTPPLRSNEEHSAGAALLGESRLGVGLYFYEMADLYFHCGVGHATHEGIEDTWFQERLHVLRPSLHQHAEGQSSREIVPWLLMAAKMNPHALDLILVGAFWLHHEAGELAMAQQLLIEAQIANPYQYEIQLERGRLYLHMGNVAAARDRFNAALAFWPSDRPPDDPAARNDKARLLLYRSLVHEVEGEKDQAIAALRESLRLYPERVHLEERIATLEAGDEPALLGPHIWNNLLQSEGKRSILCGAVESEAHVHSEDCHH